MNELEMSRREKSRSERGEGSDEDEEPAKIVGLENIELKNNRIVLKDMKPLKEYMRESGLLRLGIDELISNYVFSEKLITRL